MDSRQRSGAARRARRLGPWGRAVIAGPSMAPALHAGDHVLVRWGASVRRGDVVVARHPGRRDLLVVKRAVRREQAGWWLAGDNPYGTDDSATFGAVPEAAVLGRVVLRYWPFRRGAHRR